MKELWHLTPQLCLYIRAQFFQSIEAIPKLTGSDCHEFKGNTHLSLIWIV